nr:polyadenylate-binding protein 7 [Tanacetum cinerariifolium]
MLKEWIKKLKAANLRDEGQRNMEEFVCKRWIFGMKLVQNTYYCDLSNLSTKESERQQILRHKFEEQRKEQISKCQGLNVYVKNIDDELQECFSQCGTITALKLMVNEKGPVKGLDLSAFLHQMKQ